MPVIEVFVKPGDIVQPDDPLVTLESDKATMDVPSPVGGVVEGVRVSVGDSASAKARRCVSLKTSQTGAEPASRATPPRIRRTPIARRRRSAHASPRRRAAPLHAPVASPPRRQRRCSGRRATSTRRRSRPRMRRRRCAQFARELGVDLARVTGSGPKGRILQEDVQAFVKHALAAARAVAARTAARPAAAR